MNTPEVAPEKRKSRSLTYELVDQLSADIQNGSLQSGQKLPTEAAIMERFGVSRTVVREAISKLQAASLVETRHGIGTFVLAQSESPSFRVNPGQLSTLHDVIALLDVGAYALEMMSQYCGRQSAAAVLVDLQQGSRLIRRRGVYRDLLAHDLD